MLECRTRIRSRTGSSKRGARLGSTDVLFSELLGGAVDIGFLTKQGAKKFYPDLDTSEVYLSVNFRVST